jgi:hypothetical protein
VVRLLVFLAALGMDRQDPSVRRALDVLVRVQVRHFGADHVPAVLVVVLDREGRRRGEQQQRRPR